jgi:hypothetical protein
MSSPWVKLSARLKQRQKQRNSATNNQPNDGKGVDNDPLFIFVRNRIQILFQNCQDS